MFGLIDRKRKTENLRVFRFTFSTYSVHFNEFICVAHNRKIAHELLL